MASKKTTDDVIAVDVELRRWIELIKARYATTDDVEALRRVILAAHPEIERVAK